MSLATIQRIYVATPSARYFFARSLRKMEFPQQIFINLLKPAGYVMHQQV